MYLRSYIDEPGLLQDTFGLLDLAFPGIARATEGAEVLGLDWAVASTPFIKLLNDEPIAHVGVLNLPLVLQGEQKTVAAIHAVCTHPDHRGRGHYREVMTEAMGWVNDRYETAMLLTNYPAMYEPFGFRVVPESVFCVNDEIPVVGNSKQAFRRLNWAIPADVEFLLEVAGNRVPVSSTLGVAYEPHVFAFNALDLPVYYCLELGVLVSFAEDHETLHIFDVIGNHLTNWQDLLRLVPRSDGITTIRFHFTPDGLGLELDAPPNPDARDGVLMAKGPFLPDSLPKRLPRMADC